MCRRVVAKRAAGEAPNAVHAASLDTLHPRRFRGEAKVKADAECTRLICSAHLGRVRGAISAAEAAAAAGEI